MSERELRVFGGLADMYADIDEFLPDTADYGSYHPMRREYTYPNGNRVQWIIYKGPQNKMLIAGLEFTKVMFDVSLVGLEMADFTYILSRLRGIRQ